MKAKLIVIITFIVITIAYSFAIVKIYNDGKTENYEKYSISMYNAIANTKEVDISKGIINVNYPPPIEVGACRKTSSVD